jgi:hypothetical protein
MEGGRSNEHCLLPIWCSNHENVKSAIHVSLEEILKYMTKLMTSILVIKDKND